MCLVLGTAFPPSSPHPDVLQNLTKPCHCVPVRGTTSCGAVLGGHRAPPQPRAEGSARTQLLQAKSLVSGPSRGAQGLPTLQG